MKQRILIACLVVVLTFIFVGCGSNDENSLDGRWVRAIEPAYSMALEFSGDRFVNKLDVSWHEEEVTVAYGTFSVSDGQIEFRFEGGHVEYSPYSHGQIIVDHIEMYGYVERLPFAHHGNTIMIGYARYTRAG